MSETELFARLSRKDYAFIEQLPERRYAQTVRLGAEAPWYFALHLRDAGMTGRARAMFAVAVARSPEPWSKLAAQDLCRIGSNAERLSSIQTYRKNWPDDRQFDEAFTALQAVQAIQTPDTVLSVDLLVRFFTGAVFSVEAAPLLTRVQPEIDSALYQAASARLQLLNRDFQRAWLTARPLIESASSWTEYPAVLSDFGKAALYGSTDDLANAALFDKLAASDLPKIRYIALFYAARLYARSGAAGRTLAFQRFDAAMESAPDAAAFDNALWYRLALARDSSAEQFLSDMLRYAPSWKNAAWYSDLLETLTLTLTTGRNWKALASLYAVLPDSVAPAQHARLAYLAGRANEMLGQDGDPLFQEAWSSDHGNFYYRALAAERLNLSIGSPEHSLYGSRSQVSGDGAVKPEELLTSAVLQGYVRYQLPELLYPAVRDSWPDISLALARTLSAELAAAGYLPDSMRLISHALFRSSEPITDVDLRLAYPRPYLAEVSAAASRFGINEYLLYALMRTESFFQSDVTSRAGAVGLCQLMPATAADVARKLRIAEYDLRNPETNITFGAFYLAELVGRLENRYMPALFAYNAGITRVRTWQRAAASLDEDIFLETIPFLETREYGRKVLAAMAVYGYLYYEKNSAAVVREIFH